MALGRLALKKAVQSSLITCSGRLRCPLIPHNTDDSVVRPSAAPSEYTSVMGDPALKYLDMLQAVITRMAGNQFTCRAWSVALGTAVIGYAVSKDGKPAMAILALLPAICFWIQDAYYLGLERAFRKKFTDAVADGDKISLFDFAITPKPGDFIKAFFRPAVLLVHLPVVLLAIIVWKHA
jgi:hypothetical protein